MGIEGIENLQEEGAVQEIQTSGTEIVTGDPTPSGPTTSPDVIITTDPGPAPEGDAPVDDGSHVIPLGDNDPPSDDAVETVDPLAEDEAGA
jgi:hypothetical protein